MKRLSILLSAIAITVFASACNVHLAGAGDAPVVPENSVKGPDISGTWNTACSPDLISSGYKTLNVTYQKGTVSRASRTFYDSNCSRMSNDKVENGTYRFVEAHKDGSYTVEYKFPIGGGWSSLPKENILLEGDTLYISDYVIGDSVPKSQMLPAHRVAP